MECDFLLIDDIQRMKQSASQEIFFNLYNKLIAENKQIIITSDIHPSELKGIEKPSDLPFPERSEGTRRLTGI